MIYKTEYESPLGKLMLVSDGENIVGLWLYGQKYFAGGIKEEMVVQDELAVFDKAKKWLDRYFHGEKVEISELPLLPAGSDFRKAVWKILCEIPYGQTMTYGDIAKKMAVQCGKNSMSAQAVGGAVGHNPISIIIPCHRVVGTNKSLTGFAGGIDKKLWLLKHEGINVDQFTVPLKGTAL